MSWRIPLAILLVVLGVLALLGNLGFLAGTSWVYLLSAALILVGIFLLWSARPKPYILQTDTASAPLENATRATFNLKHGIGHLKLTAENNTALLFSGTFVGGVTQKISRDHDAVMVELKTPAELWSHLSNLKPREPEWNVKIHAQLPTTLQYEGGAGQAQLDFSRIHLTNVDIQTGASPTDIILPSPQGTLRLVIHSGAAPVHVRVPTDVRASIRGAPGLGLLDADTTRFTDRGFGILQSDGYAEATDRIEITIEGGIGRVEIR
jgi:hypothetical protein